jgi:glycosyltransferase involved in cell wall biosynthesis
MRRAARKTRWRPVVLLLGPSRGAISGVSTHVNVLLGSALGGDFELAHFQVGSEGRAESALARVARLAIGPFQLAAAILRRGAAVVHVNTSLMPRSYWRDLANVAAAKLCGARVAYQVHGGAAPDTFFAHPLLKGFLRATLRLPDALVVLGTPQLEAYRAFVPGTNIAAIPNGIDFKRPDRNPNANAPLRLLYIGRLAPRKGLGETLVALAAARSSGLAARLVIAGAGPEERLLRQQVNDYGLENAVTFAGPTYGEDKKKLLAAADVLILASHAEGLPYALLEAMAAGVVPVVTPVGAITDVVQCGVHGVFVPIGDAGAIAAAIRELACERERLARMSAACSERVAARYSVERLADDFGALYRRLADRRRPRTPSRPALSRSA